MSPAKRMEFPQSLILHHWRSVFLRNCRKLNELGNIYPTAVGTPAVDRIPSDDHNHPEDEHFMDSSSLHGLRL